MLETVADFCAMMQGDNKGRTSSSHIEASLTCQYMMIWAWVSSPVYPPPWPKGLIGMKVSAKWNVKFLPQKHICFRWLSLNCSRHFSINHIMENLSTEWWPVAKVIKFSGNNRWRQKKHVMQSGVGLFAVIISHWLYIRTLTAISRQLVTSIPHAHVGKILIHNSI